MPCIQMEQLGLGGDLSSLRGLQGSWLGPPVTAKAELCSGGSVKSQGSSVFRGCLQ